MTAIATQELAQAWGELQAIVPVTAIHTEQQYERAARFKTVSKQLNN